jgi:hypothetical protein
MSIQLRQDHKRGCGWRQPGGIYLVSDGVAVPCGKLPIPLTICPTCHHGIHPSRGWTWIDGGALIAGHPCEYEQMAERHCLPFCVLREPPFGRVGLLWIGGQFYTPREWMAEAQALGVSRRISAVPKDFKLGETWVFVAHREAIPSPDGKGEPGVFHLFQPTAIEYVVKGTETEEKLAALERRGITPVRIERIGEEAREPR